MLVLMRRVGEEIVIGEDIRVTVTRIEGNKVYIGFTAPKNVPINREEIYERIKRERDAEADEPEASTSR